MGKKILDYLRSGQFALIAFAVFTVAVIIAIVWALTHPTPEAGLMEERPAWTAEHFPLKVCAETYGYQGEDLLPALQHTHYMKVTYAIETINNRLGFEAYRMSGGDDCNIHMSIGEPAEPGWMDPGGTAIFDAGEAFCSIVTANAHGEVLTLVIEHEMGHCLGLADDEWGGSIMREVQSETEMGSFPPRITDSDRDLLRQTYLN